MDAGGDDAKMVLPLLHSYVNLHPTEFDGCRCWLPDELDLLQTFLPSPFKLSSMQTLIPPSPGTSYVSRSSSYPPSRSSSSTPFASTSSCLASVSVSESIPDRPIEGLLRFFFQTSHRKRTSQRQKVDHHGLTLHGIGRQTTLARERPIESSSDELSDQRGKPSNKGGLDTKKASKHLLAGALSAIISRTLVAPLERLKLEYLVRGATADVHHVVGAIYQREGFRGFWKGNLMNLIRTAPFKSINFYAYDTIRNQITSFTGRKDVTNLEKLAAGAAAGVFATILCFPLDTIRIRLVAPGGDAMGGIVGCCQHLINKQGVASLYAGIVPALMSMAPTGAVFYGVYDILKSGYLASPAGREALRRRAGDDRGHMEMDPWRTLLYGAIAGACAETVMYPFEVVRRRLQLQDAATRLGVLCTAKNLVEQGGIGALYAGLLPSTLQVLPSAALSYFIYEWMKLSMNVS